MDAEGEGQVARDASARVSRFPKRSLDDWLGERDSNPRWRSQSPQSCH